MVQGSCTLFTQRQSVGEVGARLGQGGEDMLRTKDLRRTGGWKDVRTD